MFLDRIKAGSEIVPPGYMKRWTIDTGVLKNFVRDKPLQLRVRFRTSRANDGETYATVWVIGDPDSSSSKRITQILPPESFQEFNIPNLIDNNGKLTIDVANPPSNGVDLLFDANDGLEVLYPESSFGMNFVRGLSIIFCWLTLLATIGLAAGSLLSFPVAAFFSLAVLIVGFLKWHHAECRSGVAHAGLILHRTFGCASTDHARQRCRRASFENCNGSQIGPSLLAD